MRRNAYHHAMGRTLGTMLTMTTYGTWLRGDQRGWIDDGVVCPPDPKREAADRARMKHQPFRFRVDQLHDVGEAIGRALIDRKQVTVLALTVETWHMHVVIGATRHDVGVVVKCVKDAARYALCVGRPIWGAGYDKRYCFDAPALQSRVAYVERHNLRRGLAPRPWPFITDIDAYLAHLAPGPTSPPGH
jgi:hypothetical protein